MTFSESSLHGSLKIGQAMAPVLGLPSGAQLHRLFRRPDADWVPAPPAYREGRVDPPKGHKEAFGMLYLAEYKRRQAPPGVKLGKRNFGRDRRYPITNAFRTA